MPVQLTTEVGNDLLAAANAASPACLIDWEAEGVEGADWRFESDPLTWADGLNPEDFINLVGCTATVRVTTKQDGSSVVTIPATCTNYGTVIATLSASATVLAPATRGRRRAWWECELALPDGRRLWLWRGTFTIDQKGTR